MCSVETVVCERTRSEILRGAGLAVQTVHSAVDWLKEFALPSFDAVLVHVSIRYQSGADLVPLLKKLRPEHSGHYFACF
jgi:hypothetical protein